MKGFFLRVLFLVFSIISLQLSAQPNKTDDLGQNEGSKQLFIDVHQLKPGVKYKDVAAAHIKDLAVQEKYGVHILKFWMDQKKGQVYCLASSPDAESLRKTHAEAHGLLPEHIYHVTPGPEATTKINKQLYLDVHYLGAGKVKAEDVAAAHQKDLAVQNKNGVNFINYWFDEKEGVVMCLVEAKDSAALIRNHKEAHGLVPASVMKVREGK
jgi:hypothetical protein